MHVLQHILLYIYLFFSLAIMIIVLNMGPIIIYHFRVTDDGVQTRAHLESQLASSLALKSPNEYRQCLLSYIRFLARSGHPLVIIILICLLCC